MSKRLRILAGPNGSGKSSVYEALVQDKGFRWGVFVNADEIEKKLREEQYLNIQCLFLKLVDSFMIIFLH